MHKVSSCFLLVLPILISACQNPDFDEPSILLDEYYITEGFDLSVVASEPFLEAPVAMDFDAKGRMWVVEMRGYMMNLDGIGENEPNGRITILEDLDRDGVVDHSKVFLDNLVLPRALSHVYGGLLYAEPPNLWFVEIEDDRPGERTLVDSIYADAGNVEHQPNGLMMNIDNWIYNAKSNFRYQRKNGQWIKEPTSYRGQWGITKDNFGRLYYNNNSRLLMGDYVLPNTVIKNKYFQPSASINQSLTPTQRVYPLHPTSVNRGYNPGILNSDSLLVNTTSACGPLIYRGDQYPADYALNAFSCVPEANLIKRIVLSFDENKISGEQAWEDKEFIAATDEGFRPVNLVNGPDGAIYIVDMHRGIIQHKAFISQYLTKHLKDKQLDSIMGMGRILRVKSTGNPLNPIPNLANAPATDLINMLSSPNGWIRDNAQQLLILKQDKSIVENLRTMVKEGGNYATQLHALYVLEGLDALSFDFLQDAASGTTTQAETIAHILVLLENYAVESNVDLMVKLISDLVKRKDPLTDFYLACSLNPWIKFSPEPFLSLLSAISSAHEKDPIIQEAITSGLSGLEESSTRHLTTNELLAQNLNSAIQNKKDSSMNAIFVNVLVNEDNRTNGLKLFRNICAACHSPSGEGIQDIAPPLKESEYVTGSINRLASIILHGMEGPVHVNNTLYELNGVMPGLADNQALTDQDIVDIINYLQNAFVHDRKGISPNDIKELRKRKPEKNAAYTEEILRNMIFEK